MKPKVLKGMGERMRAARESLKLSREAFAEQIGVSASFVAEIELERKSMSYVTIARVCESLSLSADYLLFGKSEKANTDQIIEMLSNLDQEYVDNARELLKLHILAIGKARTQ